MRSINLTRIITAVFAVLATTLSVFAGSGSFKRHKQSLGFRWCER